MPVYTGEDILKLASNLKGRSKLADKAAADTINKTATFSISESIREVQKDNNLSENYLRTKVRTSSRASASNLRAVVKAQDRRTLLSRYPYQKVSDGVRVSVKRGSFKKIRKATVISLRSGNGKGIALSNRDYFSYLKNTSPQKSTRRGRKLAKALNNSINKPFGKHVLHGASVNQMFFEVRGRISGRLGLFMIRTFNEDFRRVSR